MRDTTKDTERVSRVMRWILNNLPGEPSIAGEDPADTIIRLLPKPPGPRERCGGCGRFVGGKNAILEWDEELGEYGSVLARWPILAEGWAQRVEDSRLEAETRRDAVLAIAIESVMPRTPSSTASPRAGASPPSRRRPRACVRRCAACGPCWSRSTRATCGPPGWRPPWWTWSPPRRAPV